MKGVNKGKISERREEAAALIVFAKLSPSERDLWANRSLCVVKPQWEFVFSPAYPCVLPRVKFTFHPPVVQQFQQRHRRSICHGHSTVMCPLRSPWGAWGRLFHTVSFLLGLSFWTWFHWLPSSYSVQMTEAIVVQSPGPVSVPWPFPVLGRHLIRRWNYTIWSSLPSGAPEAAWSCLQPCLPVLVPQPFLLLHTSKICVPGRWGGSSVTVTWEISRQWTEIISLIPSLAWGAHRNLPGSQLGVCGRARGPISRAYIWPCAL